MNIILNGLQSNTKRGDIVLPSAVDLTGKENYLLKITNASGKENFALPTATDDYACFVCMSGGAAAADTAGEAPGHEENFRGVLKGTCSPGDTLSLADPGTAADAGKLRKTPTTTGTFRVFAIAEEAGVDGQYILARRVSERTVTNA